MDSHPNTCTTTLAAQTAQFNVNYVLGVLTKAYLEIIYP